MSSSVSSAEQGQRTEAQERGGEEPPAGGAGAAFAAAKAGGQGCDFGVAELGADGPGALDHGLVDVALLQQWYEAFADDATGLQVSEVALQASSDLDAQGAVVDGDDEEDPVVSALLTHAP